MPQSKLRRKHRLLIDVTYNCPVLQRDAAKGVQLKLDTLGINANPVWPDNIYIDKVKVLEPNPNALKKLKQ